MGNYNDHDRYDMAHVNNSAGPAVDRHKTIQTMITFLFILMLVVAIYFFIAIVRHDKKHHDDYHSSTNYHWRGTPRGERH